MSKSATRAAKVPKSRGATAKTAAPPAGSSVEALYAHALAIERESVRRYTELSGRMAELGEDVLSDLFQRLARFEEGHVAALGARTKKLTMPEVSGEQAWIGAEVMDEPQTLKVTPREALELSLAAEQRAEAFYRSLAAATSDAAVRALASDFAAEEQTHVETIRYALDRLPGPPRGNGEDR